MPFQTFLPTQWKVTGNSQGWGNSKAKISQGRNEAVQLTGISGGV